MGRTWNNSHQNPSLVERVAAGPVKRFVLVSIICTLVPVMGWLCVAHFLLTDAVAQDFAYWAPREVMVRTWRIKFVLCALLLGIGAQVFFWIWRGLVLRGEWRGQKRMSAWAVLRAYAVIWVLVIASGLALEVRPEPWPFLAYPMYAGVLSEYRFETYVIRGAPKLSDSERVDFFKQRFAGQPSPAGLVRLLRKRIPGADAQGRMALAKEIYQRYERGRVGKLHDGPAFEAIEIVRLSWDLKRDDVNFDRPHSQKLIVRYKPR